MRLQSPLYFHGYRLHRVCCSFPVILNHCGRMHGRFILGALSIPMRMTLIGCDLCLCHPGWREAGPLIDIPFEVLASLNCEFQMTHSYLSSLLKSWRFLGFTFVCSGGQRRPLLGTERLGNVKELDMLSSHNLSETYDRELANRDRLTSPPKILRRRMRADSLRGMTRGHLHV